MLGPGRVRAPRGARPLPGPRMWRTASRVPPGIWLLDERARAEWSVRSMRLGTAAGRHPRPLPSAVTPGRRSLLRQPGGGRLPRPAPGLGAPAASWRRVCPAGAASAQVARRPHRWVAGGRSGTHWTTAARSRCRSLHATSAGQPAHPRQPCIDRRRWQSYGSACTPALRPSCGCGRLDPVDRSPLGAAPRSEGSLRRTSEWRRAERRGPAAHREHARQRRR
ncbi:MAG: hypothetical protein JWM05_798, partial [Acidimicrobiales bacterium]|nr:hypothetical protein [Acidimicrobiales bacterium]